MSDYTVANKSTGDSFSATDHNSLKTAINSKLDEVGGVATDTVTLDTLTAGKGVILKCSGLSDFKFIVENTYGGAFWEIRSSSRFDLRADTIYLGAGNGIFFENNLAVTRTGDASSTATQKDANTIPLQTSMWTGSAEARRYSGLRAIASTATNLLHRLGLFVGATTTAMTDGYEALSMYSNGVVQRQGSPLALASDVTNATTSFADITALSFAVVSGNTYSFKFFIHYTCNATTTGSAWAINGPTATFLSYRTVNSLTTTTQTINEGLTTYNATAASASSAATSGNIAVIEGVIKPSANGTVIGRFLSEVAVASGIVAKAGSYVEFQQIA